MDGGLRELVCTRRTDNGLYKANDLLDMFNTENGTQKELADYLRNNSTKELISELAANLNGENSPYLNQGDDGNLNMGNYPYLKHGDDGNLNVGNYPYLKRGGRHRTSETVKGVIETRRGKNGGTYMHELLWFDFMMWLSPKYKVAALTILRDSVIGLRLEAVDAYKEFHARLQTLHLTPHAFIQINRALKMYVYGTEYHDDSNVLDEQAEERLLKERIGLMRSITDMIDEGYMKDYDDVIRFVKSKYRKRYGKELWKKDAALS